jgi:hypothetical protein
MILSASFMILVIEERMARAKAHSSTAWIAVYGSCAAIPKPRPVMTRYVAHCGIGVDKSTVVRSPATILPMTAPAIM